MQKTSGASRLNARLKALSPLLVCALRGPMTEDRLLQRCLHGRHDRARS